MCYITCMYIYTIYIYTHIHPYIYIYIHTLYIERDIHMYVCIYIYIYTHIYEVAVFWSLVLSNGLLTRNTNKQQEFGHWIEDTGQSTWWEHAMYGGRALESGIEYFRCLWTNVLFCASLCPAVRQQKLQSSLWFGLLKADLSIHLLIQRSVFCQTPIGYFIWQVFQ